MNACMYEWMYVRIASLYVPSALTRGDAPLVPSVSVETVGAWSAPPFLKVCVTLTAKKRSDIVKRESLYASSMLACMHCFNTVHERSDVVVLDMRVLNIVCNAHKYT